MNLHKLSILSDLKYEILRFAQNDNDLEFFGKEEVVGD